jgi:hypothetical protein
MKRTLARTAAALGATAALVALTPGPVNAGTQMVNVTGTAQCDTAGPVGRFQINWTVANGLTTAIDIVSAEESGAVTGTVTFTPDPIPATSNGVGSDGPFPGNTSGTVTLTVAYNIVGGPSDQTAIGTVNLPGNCVIPSTTSTSTAPTSSSSTSSTVLPTSTTVRSVTATPRFTG